MKKVIQFPKPRKKLEEIREQTCAWLARLDAGASVEDQERLGQWLSEDPRHVESLREMADLWDQMAVLSELSKVFPLEKYDLVPVKNKYFPRREILVAGAASLFGLGVFSRFTFRDIWPADSAGAKESQSLLNFSYETAVGEQLSVDLPDGSTIMLNTDTQIEVTYSDLERNIILKRGEGLFTVVKDAQRPFRVYAIDRVVEAVGTTFTVQRTQQEDIEVIVREGKVNFFRLVDSEGLNGSLPKQNINLALPDNVAVSAGEYAVTENNRVQKRKIQPEEIEARLAWNHGMLLFQGESLAQVLSEVGRYTLIEIEAEADIQDIRVEGYFRAGDIDGLLVAMQNNFQIEVHYLSLSHILLTSN